MIITTTETIANRKVTRTLGLVDGHALAYSREEAIQRMVEDAERLGANAIIGVRFTTGMALSGAAELLAYGTAVVTEAA
ncbi:MAG: heavy metal-binding domain-containing protein [Chloroflexi bacterium]|nr:heavy metal-binding domain-containing protein [Chloroflexota bacterium]